MVAMLNEPITSSGLAPLLTGDGLTGIRLFKGGLDPNHVVQQRLTNCPLPAILAALAHASPKRIKNMIQEHGSPVQARFFASSSSSGTPPMQPDKHLTVKFQGAVVKITPYLFVDNSYKPRFARSTEGAGWASYIEKAYVVHRAGHRYETLNLLSASNPLTVERVMEDVVHEFDKIEIGAHGGTVLRDLDPINDAPPDDAPDAFNTSKFKDLNASQLRSKVVSFLKKAKTKATVATTTSSPGAGLTGLHTLAVLSYSSKKVKLYDAMHNTTKTVGRDAFILACDAIYQER